MTNTLNIRSLSIAFKTDAGSIKAVDAIDFGVTPGKTVALLGESGCGKSLTTLAIMRLLPDFAAYGMQSEVNLSGVDILNLAEKEMRTIRGKRIAIIFQEPMTALNPVLTIGEQLKEALVKHNALTRKQLKERMISLLYEVEIAHAEKRLQQYPHQLSGGQKQRVVIAMALASNPEILIADEPTTALDVTIQAQILNLLKKLQLEHQMGLLLITHDLGVVRNMADTVYVMYAGQIVEHAEKKAFFSQPLHPYSQQLLASLPTLAKRGQALQYIAGSVPSLTDMPGGCRFHPRCAHVFAACRSLEPELQAYSDTRLVRCHLYPDHQTLPCLPSLEVKNESRVDKAQDSEVLLAVNDLKVHFTLKHNWRTGKKAIIKAVDGLSFKLQQGKTLALVGESGCGKSTTARALLRLSPITAGTIHFGGQDIKAFSGRFLRTFRKEVQIVFQDPFSSMNPRMTVADILAEGLQFKGLNAKEQRQQQMVLLDKVNLASSSLNRYPHQFSGGQRQRIAIARALATEPKLLICDEPTSALDISVQAQILNLLKSLQKEQGLSYLFITHNLAVVSYLADDILVMRHGKVVEEGACEAVIREPQHPYTRQLLSSVLVV